MYYYNLDVKCGKLLLSLLFLTRRHSVHMNVTNMHLHSAFVAKLLAWHFLFTFLCQTLLSPQHQTPTAMVLCCITENVFCYISFNLTLVSFKMCVYYYAWHFLQTVLQNSKKKKTFYKLWLDLDVIIVFKEKVCVSLV